MDRKGVLITYEFNAKDDINVDDTSANDCLRRRGGASRCITVGNYCLLKSRALLILFFIG